MYLVDTNVISEARKGKKANPGVIRFFKEVVREDIPLFLSVVTIGEIRRGIELIRHRGDTLQARRLEKWLSVVLENYRDHILDFDIDAAQTWGRLRVPHHQNALDKQIAATAIIYGLTVVTRNSNDFQGMNLGILNPFEKRQN